MRDTFDMLGYMFRFEDDKLPTERTWREAVKIYTKQLYTFFVSIVIGLFFVSFIIIINLFLFNFNSLLELRKTLIEAPNLVLIICFIITAIIIQTIIRSRRPLVLTSAMILPDQSSRRTSAVLIKEQSENSPPREIILSQPGSRISFGLGATGDLDFYESDSFITFIYAVIFEQDQQFIIRSDSSQNGTYVNDKMLQPLIQQLLHDGDIIRFGDGEVTYRFVIE